MRGVVFLGHRKLEVREFPDPTPGPGEVVIAIKADEVYRLFDTQTTGKGVFLM